MMNGDNYKYYNKYIIHKDEIILKWYESTKCCLENSYDNVIVGGYIVIFDDRGGWYFAKP